MTQPLNKLFGSGPITVLKTYHTIGFLLLESHANPVSHYQRF
jgi:hypothetical protein